MKRVVLSLGSNVCDRSAFLSKSCELIGYRIGKVVRCSRVYETPAWGFVANPFLNQVVVAETELTPERVLETILQIERELGRTRKSERGQDGAPIYHDRTIDVDILLFEGEVRSTDSLTIPHPLIPQREFVLQPLAELFGTTVVPPYTTSFQKMLSDVKTNTSVL